jgi:protein-tyrosine kinase
MVERLKEAIEKARAQREQVLAAAAPAAAAAAPGSLAAPPPRMAEGRLDWAELAPVTLSSRRLQGNRIITLDRSDPAHTTFDVLRSRILKAFQDHGWTRLAITSPTKGCGKTFVAVNLALSFARQPDLKTLLVDMDLRAPNVAQTLGHDVQTSMRDFLVGTLAPETHLRRLGDNLALSMNAGRLRNAAEMILEKRTAAVLAKTISRLEPDMVIYDLPPMLVNDDAFAFLPQVDAVLLVAAAGETRAGQVEACERLFQGSTAFLGVVLNKVEGVPDDKYGYGQAYG